MISAVWIDPLDPGEIKDYTLDAAAEMQVTQDHVVDAEWELDAAAIAAGVLIHASTFDSHALVVWLKVDPADIASALWDDPGTNFIAIVTFTTNEGRVYRRSCQFTVRRL
jgi:hypothetical protein